MYDEEEQENQTMSDGEENICPQCGLRQYNSVCVNCDIEIGADEKEKTKDDDDEYDRRERR